MKRPAFVVFAIAVATLAPAAAAAKPKVYGTVARASAAARHEVDQIYFQFDPKLRQPGDAPITFHAGCRRLTPRAFRCDWTGDDPDHYTASGIVRVTFQQYGVDAVLEPGSTCVPEGAVYEQTGVDECP